MTDTSIPKPSLGVGGIIGEAFSILFGKFVPIVLAAFLPLLITTLLSIAVLGSSVALGQSEAPEDFENFSLASFGILLLLQLVAMAVGTAAVVQIAYDAKLGRPIRLGASFSNAISQIVPIVVLSIAAAILVYLGMIALILPGFYLYAMWSVLVPAIVVERVGFRGLGRSAALTKNYRWPVLGTLVLVVIIMMVVSMVVQLIMGVVLSSAGVAVGVLFSALTNAVPYGFFSVAIALIYARLREIKEGVSVDSLVEVFA